MIGIDITKISRFEMMTRFPSFLKRFNVEGNDAVSAAKTWACLEAIVKAEGRPFAYNKIRIKFPANSSPIVEDPESILKGSYALSLSHDGDILVAVALRVI